MAANRSQTILQATKNVWNRGGVAGFYQGLIPWVTISLFFISLLLCLQKTFMKAWIEASTKGAVLIFTASEVESATLNYGVNPGVAGLLGGMTGGVVQSYATMGVY